VEAKKVVMKGYSRALGMACRRKEKKQRGGEKAGSTSPGGEQTNRPTLRGTWGGKKFKIIERRITGKGENHLLKGPILNQLMMGQGGEKEGND